MAPPTARAPGVYVTELDAFPASAVGVPTAIPVFIGYTEKAELGRKPVGNKPTLIASLADYVASFGTGFSPLYNIEEVVPGAAHDTVAAAAGYDFSCRRRTSPQQWALKYYKLSPLDAPHAPLPPFALYNALRLFYANGGRDCYVVSVGPYVENGTRATVDYARLKQGLDAAAQQAGPAMLVVPDAVLLPPTGPANAPPASDAFSRLCRDMLNQCGTLRDRMAILDLYGAETLNEHEADWQSRMDRLVDNFRTDVGDELLRYGAAYFPYLATTVVGANEITYANINIADDAQRKLLQAILDDQADLLYAPNPSIQETVKDDIAAIATAEGDDVARLDQKLVNAIPLLGQIEDVARSKMSLMPPSAAMAGVYASTDNTRGVWNAPANIALAAVAGLNVSLSNEQQGDLNVPLNGKAIDAIRLFVGRGPVVWGARTLDGNSTDFRYVQVRRTLIYIEQSIEQALQPFTFAANDGQTWATVTRMVSDFMKELWAQGGLMGEKPDEAFTVACGLGSTMTAQDILNGDMIVQVTLQMIRPAEFIELTFRQKMLKPS